MTERSLEDYEEVSYGADTTPQRGSRGEANLALDKTISEAMDEQGWDDDGSYDVEAPSGGSARTNTGRSGFRSQFFAGDVEQDDEEASGNSYRGDEGSSGSQRTGFSASPLRDASRDQWYRDHGFDDEHHEAWKKAGIEPHAAVSQLATIDRVYHRDPVGTEAWIKAQRGATLTQDEREAAARVQYAMMVDHVDRTVVREVRQMMPAKVWERIEPFIPAITREIGQGKPELYQRPKELLMRAVREARHRCGIASPAPKNDTRRYQPSQRQREREEAHREVARVLRGVTHVNING